MRNQNLNTNSTYSDDHDFETEENQKWAQNDSLELPKNSEIIYDQACNEGSSGSNMSHVNTNKPIIERNTDEKVVRVTKRHNDSGYFLESPHKNSMIRDDGCKSEPRRRETQQNKYLSAK